MPQNFYELVWIFIIYAFIGWCTEVSYAALDRGIFVNRGFLNGPYCPIYGCGVVIVVVILTPLKESLLLLFAGSFLLTSILEYITGFLLEKVFHNKWWDYSNKPFNLQGYVCLKFSVYWGLACTFIMDIVHPIIYKFITMIPFVLGIIILSILMAVFVVDCFVTVSTILKFNKRLKVMQDMAEKIHKLSDELGENIYENVSIAVEKSEEFQENHEEIITKIADTTELAKTKVTDTTEMAKTKIADTTELAKTKITDTTELAKNKITETAESAKNKIADKTESAKLILSENVMEAKSSLEAKKDAFSEKASTLVEKTENYREERELAKEEKRKEREELIRNYKNLYETKNFGFKRLMKAFPDMKSKNQNETLQKYMKYFNIKKSDAEKNKKE